MQNRNHSCCVCGCCLVGPSSDSSEQDTPQTCAEGQANEQNILPLVLAAMPHLPDFVDKFFKSRAIYAKEIEGAQRIRGWTIVGVVTVICVTALAGLFMLLHFLGAEEGAKFFTQISTLLGGLLGGLGLGLSLRGRK